MKHRLGYVSNSSSSSFIIRKAVLTEEQQNKLRDFFKEHLGCYETFMEEDASTFSGEVEAHNGVDNKETADKLLGYLIESFEIPLAWKEYFDCNYCDSAELKELSDKGKKYVATLKGENNEG